MADFNILVTGANGLLGRDLMKVLQREGWAVVGLARSDWDMMAIGGATGAFRGRKFDIVVHCAAETNVDLCEKEPERAMRVNGLATAELACASSEAGAKFIYIGSCGIFRGEGPFFESSVPQPTTVYARSKIAGEQSASAFGLRPLICRVGWLFGGDRGQKKNFVEARRREALVATRMQSAGDKRGSPTWSCDASHRIAELIRRDATGIVHVANTEVASRFDYVRAILEELRLGVAVEPVSSDRFPRAAPVPNDESLKSGRNSEFGLPEMRSWRAALAQYVQETYNHD